MKSGNLNFLEPSGPVMGLLYLFFKKYKIEHFLAVQLFSSPEFIRDTYIPHGVEITSTELQQHTLKIRASTA